MLLTHSSPHKLTLECKLKPPWLLIGAMIGMAVATWSGIIGVVALITTIYFANRMSAYSLTVYKGLVVAICR